MYIYICVNRYIFKYMVCGVGEHSYEKQQNVE